MYLIGDHDDILFARFSVNHFIDGTDNLIFKRVVVLPVGDLLLLLFALGSSVGFSVLEIVETHFDGTSASSIGQDRKT